MQETPILLLSELEKGHIDALCAAGSRVPLPRP